MPEQPPPTTPVHVVLAALALPLPCPVCGKTVACRCLVPHDYNRTQHQAQVVVDALVASGDLRDPGKPPEPPTEQQYEELAKWLAEKGAHPRHVQVENGWRRLLEAEADIDLASACAQRRAGNHDLPQIIEVAQMLARHVREHPRPIVYPS